MATDDRLPLIIKRNTSRGPLNKLIILLLLALAWLLFCKHQGWCGDIKPPRNFWMGLIAEDTSGDPETYLCIASVVRNRLLKGMDSGLVSLKRKDLYDFVAKEYLYALKNNSEDLEMIAQFCELAVFLGERDYVNGAIYYEHTGRYKVPKYVKRMKHLKLVYVLYPHTKNEIKFWR